MTAAGTTAEVTDLLQHLIRNACVNDGSVGSGHEARSADVIGSLLSGPGLDLEEFDAAPGRRSLVARIEGFDPLAPRLLLLGHTDVVPANPDGWRRDPYGGDLVDGIVWGRGAVDMLNLTSSMAVAVRDLARSGFRPRGTLIYVAVADEEAGGRHGAAWLCEHEWDAVRADYVLTEWGGIPVGNGANGGTGTGPLRLSALVAEKGVFWTRLCVRGTPGHGSRPLRADNALIKAAEVVRRIAEHRPETHVSATWREHVLALGLDADLEAALLDEEHLWETCQTLPLALGSRAHACTHTTFSPNVVRGGVKTNVIPDRVELDVDIRTLPGQTGADVRALMDEILGDLRDDVDVSLITEDPASASPTGTPLWAAMEGAARAVHPGATLVPTVSTGGTDARFFRRQGAVAYGFGMFSNRMSLDEFGAMFHGNDERVDVESLRLSTELWGALARDLLA